jgi:hypothetical protein
MTNGGGGEWIVPLNFRLIINLSRKAINSFGFTEGTNLKSLSVRKSSLTPPPRTLHHFLLSHIVTLWGRL